MRFVFCSVLLLVAVGCEPCPQPPQVPAGESLPVCPAQLSRCTSCEGRTLPECGAVFIPPSLIGQGLTPPSAAERLQRG